MSKNESYSNTVRRRPGRPRGTAPFEEIDRRLLIDLSEDFILHPNVNLTEELRRRGIEKEKDLARLRARWRAHAEEFLAEGHARLKRRRQQHPYVVLFDLFDKIARDYHYFTSSADELHLVDDMMGRVHAALQPDVAEAWLASASAYAGSHNAGTGLQAAAAAFAGRDPHADDQILARASTRQGDLSDGDKAYLFAVLLYRHARALWSAEAAEAPGRDPTASINSNDGNGEQS